MLQIFCTNKIIKGKYHSTLDSEVSSIKRRDALKLFSISNYRNKSRKFSCTFLANSFGLHEISEIKAIHFFAESWWRC